jgi:hypothetical protein
VILTPEGPPSKLRLGGALMFTSHRQHCVAENTIRLERRHSEVPRFHQRDEESHTDNQLPNFDVIPNRRAAAVRACPERLSLAKEPNGNLLFLYSGAVPDQSIR